MLHFIHHTRNLFTSIIHYKGPDNVELSYKLQLFYQDLHIPPIARLGERKILTVKDDYFDLELQSDSEPIALDEIFLPNANNKTPKRIFLTSQPTFGKTTTLYKLANDWALDKPYLRHFKFLFYISLKELKDQNIEDGIVKVAKLSGFVDEKRIKELVDENQEKTLLILDGIDEISDRDDVFDVLYRRKYPDVVVLAASRTNLFSLNTEEVKKLSGGFCKSEAFEDRKVELLGVKGCDREVFIGKFVSGVSVEEIMTSLMGLEEINELLRSPLFLIVLADFILTKSDESELKLIDFIKRVVNVLIRRSKGSGGEGFQRDFDVFDLANADLKPFRTKLYSFGRVSLQGILKNEKFLEFDETTFKIYQLGLLTQHKRTCYVGSESFYEVYHPVFSHFVAAFFVWQDYNWSKFRFSKKNLNILAQIQRMKRGTLVHQFLIGLLNEKAIDFFEAYKFYSYLFHNDELSLWQVLGGVKVDDKLLESAKYCIADQVNIGETMSISPKLLKIGLKLKRIEKIYVKLDKIESFTEFAIVTYRKDLPDFYFDVYHTDENLLLKSPYLRFIRSCRSVTVTLRAEESDNLPAYFRFFEFFTAQSPRLDLKLASYPELLASVSQKWVNVTHLEYHLTNYEREIPELIKILKNQSKVKSLVLRVFVSETNEKFINDLVGRCRNLYSLEIFEDPMTFYTEILSIDFERLTAKRNAKNQWKYLSLQINLSLSCNSEVIIDPYCIRGLIMPFVKYHDVLSKISPILFESNDKMFYSSYYKKTELKPYFPLSWPGFQSVTELSLNLRDGKKELWDAISRFTKLEKLKIVFEVAIFIDFRDFVACLCAVKVKHLVFWNCSNDLSGVLFRFVDVFVKNRPEKELLSCIEVLDVNWEAKSFNYRGDVDALIRLVRDLIECLIGNCFRRVGLVGKVFVKNERIFDECVDYCKVWVKCDCYGESEEDLELDRIGMYSCVKRMLGESKRFTMTKV